MAKSKPDVNWTNKPRSEDLPQPWKILRCSKSGSPRCMILADDVLGCYVHYWGGRTRPCLRVGCEPCDKGQAPRWRGYLPVITATTHLTRLLEVTGNCYPEIERWLGEKGSLRGLVIELQRKGKVANGELLCTLREATGFASSLPSSPDVAPLLAKLWRLTHLALPTEFAADTERTGQTRIPPAAFGHSANGNSAGGNPA